MEQTRSYRPLCLSLYLNYFVHGIGVLILAQNMDSLAARWGSLADVMSVIGMLGIGRLIVLFVSGKLSDKYGRKPFVLLGMITYIAFFLGILVSPTTAVACVFGILAGIANSFLDAGTYPALIESYPESASLHFGRAIPFAALHRRSRHDECLVRLVLYRSCRHLGSEFCHYVENGLPCHESSRQQ